MALTQHLRLALRQWGRQPRLAATATFTLALGIGGATTMYAVLQAISRFGQPTVPGSEEVGRIFTGLPYENDARGPASLDDCRGWENARSIRVLAEYAQSTRLLRAAEGDDEVEVLAVHPSYFELLQIAPVIGRFYGPDESRAGVALLGERAWRSRFGADPRVLGRKLDLDGRAYTVVGVAPERLGLVMPTTDVLVPFVEADGRAAVRVLVRRQPRASWNEVRAELKRLGFASPGMPRQIRVVPILDDAAYRTRMGWLLMVGPALLVLLIGCGNVASLLLVRAVQREREMATRIALGASRLQLAVQLLVEGWVLAVAGGALGAALAWAGLRGVQAFVPLSLDVRFQLDRGVASFLAAAAFLTPLVFGVAPLLHSVRVDLSGALRAGLRKPLFGLRQYHVRDVFAVLEVGASVALVTFTFMLLSLFAAGREVGFGFAGEGLVVAQIREQQPLPHAAPQITADLPRRLRQELEALPGVTRVTIGDLPYAGGRVRVAQGDIAFSATEVDADGAYFETLALPLVRGRAIEASDLAGKPAIAVVGEELAGHLWPGEDPLGKSVRVVRDGQSETLTVVGVCKDALRLGRLRRIRGSNMLDAMRYVLYRPWSPLNARPVDTLTARVVGGPGAMLQPVRAAVQAVDPRLRVLKVAALTPTLDLNGDAGARFVVVLQLSFCALALLLAVVGVFGVMRQVVDERRAEFGVRLALGASPRNLVRTVVGDGLIRVGVGAGAAIAIVFVVARMAFGGLVGLSAADPRFWLAVTGAIALTGAAACYLPSRHAARVDPVEVLRCE